MKKRKYTKIEALEGEIIEMREAGKTRQEIADCLGLEKVQVKSWINRYNRKQRKTAAGIMPRPKGRPRKDVEPRDLIAEQGYEIKRLKMENQLLRDFLRFTGRGSGQE